MDGVASILKRKVQSKPPPTYQWQEVALEICKTIPDSYKFKPSIFKACKKDVRFAHTALNDCKELNKLYSLYFLKVFSLLCHQHLPKNTV